MFILTRLIRVEVCVMWAHKATFATRPFSDLLFVLEFIYSASSPIFLTNYGILHAGISSQSLGSIKILTKRRDLISAKDTHKDIRGHTCSYMAHPTNKAFNWRARITGLFSMAFAAFILLCISCGPYKSHKNRGTKQSPPAEPHMGGRHTYDGVLPGAPNRSFVTLLSPSQCHAASAQFLTHWLRWTRALFAVLGCYPHLLYGRLWLDFGVTRFI
jgi:hypothetical protein